MSKFNSENKFIKNLRFHLSFYFNDIDISNIISDYEEWFENEKLHGKTEKDLQFFAKSSNHNPKITFRISTKTLIYK